jgi:hypothetical protein
MGKVRFAAGIGHADDRHAGCIGGVDKAGDIGVGGLLAPIAEQHERLAVGLQILEPLNGFPPPFDNSPCADWD